MKIRFYLCGLFISLLFFTCSKEKDNFEDEPYVKPSLKVLYAESLQPINLEKSYIFTAGFEDAQYAYIDLIRLSNGNLLMTSMRDKSIEDFHPGNIIVSESSDDGKSWSSAQVLTKDISGNINSSLPSLLQLGNEHIMLIFGVKYSSSKIDILTKESFDNGKTWSKHKAIHGANSGYQILHNARALYRNGRIIIPVCIPKKADIMYSLNDVGAFYYYSDDKGKTWQKSAMITNRMALLEPGITALSNSELLMNLRTNEGTILFARSLNNGISWTFEGSDIKSPSSPQRIARIPQTDSLLMVWNNTDNNFPQHGGNRSPLSLALSTNKGYTWKHIMDLEQSPGYQFDYAYPAILIDKENIFIGYNERNNAYSSFSLKMIKFSKKDLANIK